MASTIAIMQSIEINRMEMKTNADGSDHFTLFPFDTKVNGRHITTELGSTDKNFLGRQATKVYSMLQRPCIDDKQKME